MFRSNGERFFSNLNFRNGPFLFGFGGPSPFFPNPNALLYIFLLFTVKGEDFFWAKNDIESYSYRERIYIKVANRELKFEREHSHR